MANVQVGLRHEVKKRFLCFSLFVFSSTISQSLSSICHVHLPLYNLKLCSLSVASWWRRKELSSIVDILLRLHAIRQSWNKDQPQSQRKQEEARKEEKR
ncbi:hypothetical protein SAY87_012417 [Trapa incisa]|uniref:Uncharacterized protein n=1 Tax=Trapa incisa TaxID=236973 RepID=A0AAN7GHA4_9MYRT|nr:hypothetical protein SAY87_012417 [Trapa incisa]